ncbi:hypothetical protein BI308_12065 [Roseofilum reptotaenium AO1-A]|uniref:Uncharacterized protein n=2 Tax=Desertifilaceae TaxID=1969992 RepID=A0A1L9QRS1_9CYAN|nr:hypothetical protein BI308_12065 [Roseofilum reptotaenium AO1-A]
MGFAAASGVELPEAESEMVPAIADLGSSSSKSANSSTEGLGKSDFRLHGNLGIELQAREWGMCEKQSPSEEYKSFLSLLEYKELGFKRKGSSRDLKFLCVLAAIAFLTVRFLWSFDLSP